MNIRAHIVLYIKYICKLFDTFINLKAHLGNTQRFSLVKTNRKAGLSDSFGLTNQNER